MSTFAVYINPKSRKGSSTMYYKDEDFTPEALCQEIEEMFDMDVEVEEYPQGTFKYCTVDGSPMSEDIVKHVYQAYNDCEGENSRDYVRVIVRFSLYEEEVNGDVLVLRESQFEGEYIAKWKGLTIATIGTEDDGLYAGQYSLTEWGPDQESTTTPYYHKSLAACWRQIVLYCRYEFHYELIETKG